MIGPIGIFLAHPGGNMYWVLAEFGSTVGWGFPIGVGKGEPSELKSTLNDSDRSAPYKFVIAIVMSADGVLIGVEIWLVKVIADIIVVVHGIPATRVATKRIERLRIIILWQKSV
jgi:hypothetical protein